MMFSRLQRGFTRQMRAMPIFTLLLLLVMMVMFSRAASGASLATSTLRILFSPGDHLAVGECIVQLRSSTDDRRFSENLRPGGNLALSFLLPVATERSLALYPVGIPQYSSGGTRLKILFRLPRNLRFTIPRGKKGSSVTVSFRVADEREEQFQAVTLTSETGENSSADPVSFNELRDEWKASFLDVLENAIATHEDHEMELLLHLRWKGELPQVSFKSWASDDSAKPIWGFMGLNDVRDAIPLTPPKSLQGPSVLAASNPEPIALPQVVIPDVQIASEVSALARRIPRSCYYLEWPTWAAFGETCAFVDALVWRWSPGFFPRTPFMMVESYLGNLGVTQASFPPDAGPVVLAGWDPFFAAGTSILLAIQGKDRPLEDPARKKFGYLDAAENVLLLSTSEKLLRMALEAGKKGRSLADEAGFRYSRGKLALRQKNEQEMFFLYLSDFWLTNLVSPRWVILNDRLNQTDARIRLGELLKIVWKAEHNVQGSPTLAELRKQPLVPSDWAEWILGDLEETPGGLQSKAFGGLNAHPPIDAMSFEGVTEEEANRYEKFRDSYSRLWRQMDPIAIQLARQEKSGRWALRVYQSPISRLSEFRFLRDLLLQNKPVHGFESRRGQAYGLSLAIQTKLFGTPGMVPIHIPNLPLAFFFRIWGFDGAPSTFPPGNWLEENREEDQLSKARIPIAFSVPLLVVQAVMPMFTNLSRGPSGFPGIESMRFLRDEFTHIMRLHYTTQAENGFGTFAVDPGVLMRLMASGVPDLLPAVSIASDTVPADIHAFIDLLNGATLRRWLLQQAAQNRGLESWRRKNRLRRVMQYLGQDAGDVDFSSVSNGLPAIIDPLVKNHVFPSKSVTDPSLVRGIPAEVGGKGDRGSYSSSQDLLRAIEGLPDFLLDLQRLDFFVSIEENSLLFETHAAFESGPAAVPGAAPSTVRPVGAATGSGTTSLDFDNP